MRTAPTRDPEDAALLPAGNPVRLRAVVPICLGSVVGIATLATQAPARVVLPWWLLSVMVVVVGLLDLVGSFDDEAPAAHTVSIRALAVPLASLAATIALCWLLLRLAVGGVLGPGVAALLFPLSALGTLASLFRVGALLGPWAGRPLHRREGFWLVALATLLYLPTLGSHALSDPWETHYAEVAREILARNDWISLWWAQDGFFWSKPVLSFWMQAAAMGLTGVQYEAGEMLAKTGEGYDPRPEWPLRFTVFVVVVLAVYLLYKAVARQHGRRAGFLCGVVLLSMPQFALLARQTMTDMPFVAFLCAAVATFALALSTPEDARAPVYCVDFGFTQLRLSLFHLVVGAFLAVLVPQALYLLSRNVSILTAPHFDIRLHADVFGGGSIGNCGLPGNSDCEGDMVPAVRRFEPAVQALLWIQCGALVLWIEWGERRVKRLLYLAAWLFASLSTMAKGPAGLGLPVLAALCWVISSGRWRELTRMEIVAGTLVFACTALPWIVAMYVRHGQPFTDRLLFHDMYSRAFRHVHDTNKGDDVSFRYYVWQLGYATFPWVGLAPIALVHGLRHGWRRALGDVELLMFAWFGIGFLLFTLMGTKFHHYALPLLPPLAVLTGLMLDRMMARGDARDGAIALGAAVLTLMVGRDLADSPIRLLHLITYNYTRPWPETLALSGALWALAIAASLATAAMVVARWRRLMATAFIAVAMLCGAWVVNVYLLAVSPHWSQRELMLRYERERIATPGPLVAYQMNWKGENFYRGNQLAAFVSSGRVFQDWIDAQKKQGQRTFYFVTEHKRVASLRSELGKPRHVHFLSREADNNKFVLLRVRFDGGMQQQ